MALAPTEIENASGVVETQNVFHYVHFVSCQLGVTDERGISNKVDFIKERAPPVRVNVDHASPAFNRGLTTAHTDRPGVDIT
jgi:hypothetical protein